MSQPLNNAAALRRQLMNYLPMRDYDPHANAAKLLAYRLSDELAGNALNLDNLETILTDLCKSAARDRGQKLAARAGLPELENWQKKFQKNSRAASQRRFCRLPQMGRERSGRLGRHRASDFCHDRCHARACAGRRFGDTETRQALCR